MDEITINITEIVEDITIIVSEPINLPVSTALSDFLTGTIAGTWVVKTLTQIKTILGLGSAAYTDSTDYAPIVHDHDGRYYTETEIDNMLGSIASKDFWSGTAAQYAALGTWDDNTLYFTT